MPSTQHIAGDRILAKSRQAYARYKESEAGGRVLNRSGTATCLLERGTPTFLAKDQQPPATTESPPRGMPSVDGLTEGGI